MLAFLVKAFGNNFSMYLSRLALLYSAFQGTPLKFMGKIADAWDRRENLEVEVEGVAIGDSSMNSR